jgi:N-acylglucosamine 2-epimerase
MIPVPASRTRYRDALRGDVLPFWERHSPDPVHGGFFTCLDRDGAVYDTTKFLWLQWRAVWMFATLHARVEPRPAWLALAEQGFDFLERHGRDGRGRAYFALSRRGVPAVAPYSLYTESFAALGAAALFRIAGDPVHRRAALHARDEYARRMAAPERGVDQGTRRRARARQSGRAHDPRESGARELEDGAGRHREPRRPDLWPVETVLDRFWSPEHQALFEHARPAGGFDLDSMVGRRLNPGHALEAAGFILAAAERLGPRGLGPACRGNRHSHPGARLGCRTGRACSTSSTSWTARPRRCSGP